MIQLKSSSVLGLNQLPFYIQQHRNTSNRVTRLAVITQAQSQKHVKTTPVQLTAPALKSSISTSIDIKSQDSNPVSIWNKELTLFSLLALTGGGLFGSGFDISGPGSVLEAVLVLAAVVGIHELGHFSAAKSQGIHVSKFAIGFGPVLWKYQGDEVEYSLRAFPLGGFVAFPDDDPDSPFEEDDPNLLRNRPVLDRIKVTTAGVIANIIFAFAICLVQAETVGIAEPIYSPGVRLSIVNTETVAAKAGLQQGDVLLKIDNFEITPNAKAVSTVVDIIKNNADRPLNIKGIRDGKPFELTLTPAAQPDGSGRIGVSLGPNAIVKRVKPSNPVDAFGLATKDFIGLFGTITKGLSLFVSNFKETAENVSGPVAILAVGSEVARTDVAGLYQFAALLNINLAVINILPLPALDGGFLAFQVLELLRGGKKVDAQVEKGIMASGFLLLTSMGLFLTLRDAINLALHGIR